MTLALESKPHIQQIFESRYNLPFLEKKIIYNFHLKKEENKDDQEVVTGDNP